MAITLALACLFEARLFEILVVEALFRHNGGHGTLCVQSPLIVPWKNVLLKNLVYTIETVRLSFY